MDSYVLIWPENDWCCSGETINQVLTDTKNSMGVETHQVNFQLKTKNITISKIGKPLSFKTCMEKVKPEPRCINPVVKPTFDSFVEDVV